MWVVFLPCQLDPPVGGKTVACLVGVGVSEEALGKSLTLTRNWWIDCHLSFEASVKVLVLLELQPEEESSGTRHEGLVYH